MRKIAYTLVLVCLIISACSTRQDMPTQNPPKEATASVLAYPHDEPVNTPSATAIASPQDKPTIIPTATMTDQQVFDACAETIRAYAASNRCTNWDEYRQLFSPKSGEYNTTPNPENSIYCYEVESAEVVRILTVEEWWNEENPGLEMPKSAQPEFPGERVFYVEILPRFKPDITPIPPREPGSLNKFLMWMLPENGKCLIRNHGW